MPAFSVSLEHSTEVLGDPIINEFNFRRDGTAINLSKIFNNARGYDFEEDTDPTHSVVKASIIGQYLFVLPLVSRSLPADIVVKGEGLTDSDSSVVRVTVDPDATKPAVEDTFTKEEVISSDIPTKMGVTDIAHIAFYDYISNAVDISLSVPGGSSRKANFRGSLNDVDVTVISPANGESKATVTATTLSGTEYTSEIQFSNTDLRSVFPDISTEIGEIETIKTDRFVGVERLSVFADPYYVTCSISEDNEIILEGIRPTENMPVSIRYFAPDPYDVFPVSISNITRFNLTITGESMLPEEVPTLKSDIASSVVERVPTEFWRFNYVNFIDGDGNEVFQPGKFFDFYAGDGFRDIDVITPDDSELEFRPISSSRSFYVTDREHAFGGIQFQARRNPSFTGTRTGRVFGVKLRAYVGRDKTGKYKDSNEFMVSYTL